MTTCFCGCGRKVSRFPLGIRTINKRGSLVTSRLAWARAYEADTELFRPEFFADGEQLVALFRTTVHGEVSPDVDDATVREWMFAMGGGGAWDFAEREKVALDFLEQKSSAWMKLGRDIERLGVEHARTMPINRWLEQEFGRT